MRIGDRGVILVTGASSGIGREIARLLVNNAGVGDIGLLERAREGAEPRGTGVVVSQPCPGPVATEFEENVGNFTGEKVPGIIEISAIRCAKAAVAGFDGDRAIVYPGLVYGLVMRVALWTPRVIVRIIVGAAGKILRKKQLEVSGT